MKITFNISTELELKNVASELIKHLSHSKIILLNGQMGAGKTTFAKVFCEALEVQDIPSSPTFSIVNEYFSHSQGNIYHFDLYRLKNIEEALDIGIEDYLYSGNICLIEWAELIQDLLPEKFILVTINVDENNTRTFIIETKTIS